MEHERWAKWQAYLHEKLQWHGDKLVLPTELFERWGRQINTPYADLSEAEKESDREETRAYLSLIEGLIASAEARGREEERAKLLFEIESNFRSRKISEMPYSDFDRRMLAFIKKLKREGSEANETLTNNNTMEKSVHKISLTLNFNTPITYEAALELVENALIKAGLRKSA